MVGGDDSGGEQHGDVAHLGECPRCEAAIPERNLLIDYRTQGGWPRILARCPNCREAIRPA